jgi:hypothetical protein
VGTNPVRPAAGRPSWREAARAIGVVALASALGSGLGFALRIVLSAIYPALAAPLEVLAAVLGFGLGWHWYVTRSERWAMADEEESR